VAFAAVARHRSFSRAAAEIGVSRSALSHTVRMLEERLNLRLLNRTTRSVAPTEAGAKLLAQLAPVLAEFGAIFDDLAERQTGPSGLLRINAPETAVRLLMRTVVPAFLKKYPSMRLDLAAEGRLVDIVSQGFDAGIRLADAVPLDMIAVPFGKMVRFVAVASPDYLRVHPALVVPDDLSQHRCIRQRLPSGALYQWEFEKAGQSCEIDVPGVLTLDHSATMVEAAAAGMGVAYVPEIATSERLRDGALRLVLEDWCPPSPGLCLYYPGRRHIPSGLRAFVEMLRAHLPR